MAFLLVPFRENGIHILRTSFNVGPKDIKRNKLDDSSSDLGEQVRLDDSKHSQVFHDFLKFDDLSCFGEREVGARARGSTLEIGRLLLGDV